MNAADNLSELGGARTEENNADALLQRLDERWQAASEAILARRAAVAAAGPGASVASALADDDAGGDDAGGDDAGGDDAGGDDAGGDDAGGDDAGGDDAGGDDDGPFGDVDVDGDFFADVHPAGG